MRRHTNVVSLYSKRERREWWLMEHDGLPLAVARDIARNEFPRHNIAANVGLRWREGRGIVRGGPPPEGWVEEDDGGGGGERGGGGAPPPALPVAPAAPAAPAPAAPALPAAPDGGVRVELLPPDWRERPWHPPMATPAEVHILPDFTEKRQEDAVWCAELATQDQDIILGSTPPVGYTEVAAIILNPTYTHVQNMRAGLQAQFGLVFAGHGMETHIEAAGIDLAVVQPLLHSCVQYYEAHVALPPAAGLHTCVLAAIVDRDLPFPERTSWTSRMLAAGRRRICGQRHDSAGGLVVAPDATGEDTGCGFGRVNVARMVPWSQYAGPVQDFYTGQQRNTLTAIMAEWLVEGVVYLPRALQADLAHLGAALGGGRVRAMRKLVFRLLECLDQRGDALVMAIPGWSGWIGAGFFGQHFVNSFWQAPAGQQRVIGESVVKFFYDMLGFAYYHGTAFRAIMVHAVTLRIAQNSDKFATCGTFKGQGCCQGGQLENLLRAFGETLVQGIVRPRAPLELAYDNAAAARPPDPWSRENRKLWLWARVSEWRNATPTPYGDAGEQHNNVMAALRARIAALPAPNNVPTDPDWSAELADISGMINDGYMGGGVRRRRRKKSRRRRRRRRKKTKRRRRKRRTKRRKTRRH